ncbi:MAG: Methyltransferase FkbM domain-containing protein [Pelagibacterales bacterium]|nr:Methyltransferase FkbM domain-containing protein [Pelagibacterales bacterium]
MKTIIRNFLKMLGWKLVKIKVRGPRTHPFSKPTLQDFKCISESSGVLHLGAHRGTEAGVYDWFNKKVLWVEALPNIFNELQYNIQKHYNQKAICALLGDEDRKKINFYLSNKDSSCSSVFDFSPKVKNKELWQDIDIKMNKVLKMKMRTLDSIFIENNISASDYNHWIIDLQGAELICLKGATQSIKSCKSISVEISQKEFYSGGAKWSEIKEFLNSKNFQLFEEPKEDHTEVLFIKEN